MKRKLRLFGMALSAAVAMSAVVASAATAEGLFVAGSYPATLVGVSEGTYEETIAGQTLTCARAEYHAELTEPSPELEITPSFGECELEGFSTKVRLNGCQLVSRAPEKISIDLFRGGIDLVCPGKPWEVEAPTCLITYHSQEWVENFILENDTISKRFTELHNGKNKRASVDPKVFCSLSSEVKGIEFHAAIGWAAEDAEGDPVDLYVE